MHGFCSSNALYSASCSFTMFIFLLNRFYTGHLLIRNKSPPGMVCESVAYKKECVTKCKYLSSRFFRMKMSGLDWNDAVQTRKESVQRKNSGDYQIFSRFFRWSTHLFMSLFPSVQPSHSISQGPYTIWS